MKEWASQDTILKPADVEMVLARTRLITTYGSNFTGTYTSYPARLS